MNTRIVPPRVLTMISAVLWADLDGNHVTLTYTDGSKEAATLAPERIAEGHANFLRFVSAVQDARVLNCKPRS